MWRMAPADDMFSIYRALWERAEKQGALIRYNGLMADGEGSFYPAPGRNGIATPTIEIGRPYYDRIDAPSQSRNASGQEKLPAPDLLCETATLAHEVGHFLSWKERTSPDEYKEYFNAAKVRDMAWDGVPSTDDVDAYNDGIRAAAQSVLTSQQIERILAEEQLAWDIGREVLVDLGFDEWTYYARRESDGLYFHRYRLGVEALRPEKSVST